MKFSEQIRRKEAQVSSPQVLGRSERRLEVIRKKEAIAEEQRKKELFEKTKARVEKMPFEEYEKAYPTFESSVQKNFISPDVIKAKVESEKQANIIKATENLRVEEEDKRLAEQEWEDNLKWYRELSPESQSKNRERYERNKEKIKDKIKKEESSVKYWRQGKARVEQGYDYSLVKDWVRANISYETAEREAEREAERKSKEAYDRLLSESPYAPVFKEYQKEYEGIDWAEAKNIQAILEARQVQTTTIIPPEIKEEKIEKARIFSGGILTPIEPEKTAVRVIRTTRGREIILKGEEAWRPLKEIKLQTIAVDIGEGLMQDIPVYSYDTKFVGAGETIGLKGIPHSERFIKEARVGKLPKEVYENLRKETFLTPIEPEKIKETTEQGLSPIDMEEATPTRILEPEEYKREVAEAIKAGKKVEFIPEGVRITEEKVVPKEEETSKIKKFLQKTLEKITKIREEFIPEGVRITEEKVVPKEEETSKIKKFLQKTLEKITKIREEASKSFKISTYTFEKGKFGIKVGVEKLPTIGMIPLYPQIGIEELKMPVFAEEFTPTAVLATKVPSYVGGGWGEIAYRITPEGEMTFPSTEIPLKMTYALPPVPKLPKEIELAPPPEYILKTEEVSYPFKQTAKEIATIGGTIATYNAIPSEVLIAIGASATYHARDIEELTTGMVWTGIGTIGAGAKVYKYLKEPIIKYKYLKRPDPTFEEIGRTVVYKGKARRIATYQITQKVPPIQAEVTTRFRQYFKMKPLLPMGDITAPRTIITYTPGYTLDKESFLVVEKGFGKYARKAGTISEILGMQVPTSLKAIKVLPKREQILWQKIAEKITGRPVAIENVPAMLKKDLTLAKQYIVSEKLFKITPSKGELEWIPTGKRITRAEAVSITEQIKIPEELPYKLYKSKLAFKDITKPFTRATGKLPTMSGIIKEYKTPLVLPEPDKLYVKITQKPSATLMKQIMKTPKLLPKVLPKVSTQELPKITKQTLIPTGELKSIIMLKPVIEDNTKTETKTVTKELLSIREKLKVEEVLEEEERFKEKVITKPVVRIEQVPKIAEKLKEKIALKPKIPQEPKIPIGEILIPESNYPPLLPPVKTILSPIYFPWLKGEKKRKKTLKGKIKRQYAFLPDFTAKLLEIKPMEIDISEAGRVVRKVRTGLEIRPPVRIRTNKELNRQIKSLLK